MEDESIFELRPADLKKNAEPILSQIAPFERDQFLQKRAERFKVSRIRICFPSRDEIQAQFNVQESIGDVESFLRETFSNPSWSFNLCELSLLLLS